MKKKRNKKENELLKKALFSTKVEFIPSKERQGIKNRTFKQIDVANNRYTAITNESNQPRYDEGY